MIVAARSNRHVAARGKLPPLPARCALLLLRVLCGGRVPPALPNRAGRCHDACSGGGCWGAALARCGAGRGAGTLGAGALPFFCGLRAPELTHADFRSSATRLRASSALPQATRRLQIRQRTSVA